MTTPFLNLFAAGLVLAAVQIIAALPWLWAFDPRGFRKSIKDPTILGYGVGALFGGGLLFALLLSENRIAAKLSEYGYMYYGSILHAQLAIDLLIFLPQALLLISPKTGAVALAAYR